MTYLIWTIIGLVVGGAVYWILDWKSKFPDGN